ncbi:unnamed protein product [Bursaphelenchus okinawaensis]|uniref:HTH La-type RNA-binding domain-containing protein n=1 Tax=Bursaphelenchus okinawaensis TaxID=465554 RepID=A0A811KB29_9BILA|nr:unnamed protein product [Bursaphelenchus okinawaensis]CAG9100652.1 unnamed protein product [Bursaphelenchus okinawaensis]
MAEGVAVQDETCNKAEKKWASFADSLRNTQTGEGSDTIIDESTVEDAQPNSRNSSGSTLQPEEEGFEIVSHNKKLKKTQKQQIEKLERRPRAQTISTATLHRKPGKIEKEREIVTVPIKASVEEVKKSEPAKPNIAEEVEHDASNHSSDSAFAENPSPSHGSSTSLHYAADAENQELSDSVVALSDEEKWPELSVATNAGAIRGPTNVMSSPVSSKKLPSPKSSEHDDDPTGQRRNSKTHWRKVDIDVSYQRPTGKRSNVGGRQRPTQPQSHGSLDSAEIKSRETRKSLPARTLSQKYNNSESAGNSDTNGVKDDEKERQNRSARYSASARYDNDTDDSQSNVTYNQRSENTEKDQNLNHNQSYQPNHSHQRRYNRPHQQRLSRHSIPAMPLIPFYYMADPTQVIAAVQQQQSQENGTTSTNNNTVNTSSTAAAFIPITQSNLFYNVPTANFFMPFPPALAQFNGQTSMPQFVQPPLMYQGVMPVVAASSSSQLPATSTPSTTNNIQDHTPIMAPIGVPPPPVGQFVPMAGLDPFGLPPTSFLNTQQNFGYPVNESSIQFAKEIGNLVKRYFPASTDKILGDLSSHQPIVENFERQDRLLVLRYQLQFYFSPKNLLKDWYLCSRMDSEGFVPLSEIAKFPRVKMLHLELKDLIDAIQNSDVLELKDADTDTPLIRTRINPTQWAALSGRKHSGITSAAQSADEQQAPARRLTIGTDVSVDDVRQRLMKTRFQSTDLPPPVINGNGIKEPQSNDVFEDDGSDWANVKGKKKSKKGRISNELTGDHK